MIETRSEPAVTTAVRAALDVLTPFADAPLWSLSEGEKHTDLVLLAQLRTMVAELELRHAHAAVTDDGVDVKTSWVRTTITTPREAGSRLRLAAALDRHEPLRAAMARGQVSEAQARVVAHALDELATDLDPQIAAEAELIGLCAVHHPDELRRLGRKVLEVLAPEVYEAQEAARVEAEYRRAQAKKRFTLTDLHDGTWSVREILPSPVAWALRKILMAFASPGHRAASGRNPVYGPERMGEAFCDFVEHYPADTAPRTGGTSTRVMVNLDLDDLTARLTEHGVATVDGMVDIPAWEARRIACEAGILPVVLNGKSEILDLGRTRRFHNDPQRTAAHYRDKTCRTDGCDWPAWASHLHHRVPWSRGGSTTLDDAISLCPKHHRRAHDPTFTMTMSRGGKVIFRRT